MPSSLSFSMCVCLGCLREWRVSAKMHEPKGELPYYYCCFFSPRKTVPNWEQRQIFSVSSLLERESSYRLDPPWPVTHPHTYCLSLSLRLTRLKPASTYLIPFRFLWTSALSLLGVFTRELALNTPKVGRSDQRVWGVLFLLLLWSRVPWLTIKEVRRGVSEISTASLLSMVSNCSIDL